MIKVSEPEQPEVKRKKGTNRVWIFEGWRTTGVASSISCFASGLKGQLVLMKISPSVKKALQGFAIIQSLPSGVERQCG